MSDQSQICIMVCCVLFVLEIFTTPNPAEGQSNGFQREMLLTTANNYAINPLVVVAAEDNQFVLAGEIIGNSAWATKVDADGKIVWTYTRGLLAEDIAAFHGALFSPRFTGAVPMSDGTTYLCGTMPRPPADYAPGLLVHLDGAGHVLSTQFVVPKQRNAHGIARFSSCIRWGDGVVVVGYVWHTVRAGEVGAPNPAGPAYWLVAIGGDGQIRSEMQIRSSINSGSLEVGPAVRYPNSDSGLVFGATENINTEFIRVNPTGKVEAVKRLSGRFLLARPVAPDEFLQIYGAFGSENTPNPRVVMTLDDQFNEISRAEGAHPTNLGTRLAYRMPDRSLALFGSGASGAGHYSSIAHIASDLQSEQDFDLPRDKIYDSGSIWAATPTAKLGEFAVAASAVARGFDNRIPGSTGMLSGFTRGAVLDFVKIK